MNTSRRDLYAEERREGEAHGADGVEGANSVNNEAQAMLDRIMSAGWSNASATAPTNKVDEGMNTDTDTLTNMDEKVHTFKLLSNAPVTQINVNEGSEGDGSGEYDVAVREHNERMRRQRQSSPPAEDVRGRLAQLSSIAVDGEWVEQQRSVYWQPLRRAINRSRRSTQSLTNPAPSLALAKTDIDDEEKLTDKQGRMHTPSVEQIALAPSPATAQLNSTRRKQYQKRGGIDKVRRMRSPPAFFAATPDQCKYAASAAYFYGKPSSRPFNRPAGCQRKYVRGDSRGITAGAEYKRKEEAERLAHRATVAEEKAKAKDRKRVEGRGTGRGDTLGVSRVGAVGAAAATGANAA
ncbi:hypothetical protein E3P77_00130 [Wallemia ichthyophaga]|nr:hypothetical protein E3P77_00130 [Wallemia ichthyophaga]